MRRSILHSSVGLSAIVATMLAAGPVAAQSPSPGAMMDLSPNPEECVVPVRRELAELQAIIGEAPPDGAHEEVKAGRTPVPSVERAAGETLEEEYHDLVIASVRRQMACYNAGDYLAGFSGVTDEFLQSQVGEALFDEGFVAVLEAAPVPLPEEQQTVLLGVREIMIHDDGTVSALVDYRSPTPQLEGIDGVETDLWTLIPVEGFDYLLHAVVEDVEHLVGPAASPAG
jgi:hypothetical protein